MISENENAQLQDRVLSIIISFMLILTNLRWFHK